MINKKMKEQQLRRVRNKKVKIVCKGDGEDEHGFPVKDSWIEVRETWSSVRGLRNREFYEAQQVQAQEVKIFNFKFFEGLTQDMFVEYPTGSYYNIDSINNLGERNIEYEIHAKKVSPSE